MQVNLGFSKLYKNMPRETNIQIRRGSSTEWTSANPTLSNGEIAIETNTKKLKVGDGSTAWNNLKYVCFDGGDIDAPTVPSKPVVISVVSFSNEITQATYSFNNGGLVATPTFFFDDNEEAASSDDATSATFEGAFLGTTFRMSVTNALGTSPLSDPVVVGGD
jgi:hypothetical protein